jgi:hypothetical protein
VTADLAAPAPDSPADEREGVLEELDGTPVGSAGPASRTSISWRSGASRAAALTATRPWLWAYALVAFLARGGILLLTIPIVVLPTFLGIAAWVGPVSVTPEGPTPRLVALVMIGFAVGVVAAVAGTVVAAAAETTLLRATVAEDGGDPGFMAVAAPAGLQRGTIRIVAVRLALLLPVAVVIGLAVPAWVAAAYRELTLPSDVATPLLARVLAGAPVASTAVAAVWLAAEVVGGFATRRAVLLDTPAWRALVGGFVDPVRAPLGTLLTVVAALAVSVAALLPAGWAAAAAWDAARRVLAGEASAIAALAVALGVALAWLAALLVAGIVGAWRGVLMTAELLRRRPTRSRREPGHPAAIPDASRHAPETTPVR